MTRPSVSKGKLKGQTTDNPQSKVHKDYTQRTRSGSRKSTSTELDEAFVPPPIQEELMEQVKK